MQWNGSILVASAVAAIGICVTIRIYLADKRTKKVEDRKKNISEQLVEFYAPLLTLLQISSALSRKFFEDKPEDFNLLTYLLDKDHLFNGNTKVSISEEEMKLLDEIIALSDDISKLIVEKSGLVEDTTLNINYKPDSIITNIKLDKNNSKIGLLGLLLSHYKVIKYARNKIIQGDVDYYDQFKFPREVVRRIENNYTNLKNELDNL